MNNEQFHRLKQLGIATTDRTTAIQRAAVRQYVDKGSLSHEVFHKSERERDKLKKLRSQVDNAVFEKLCKKGIIK